MEPEAYSYIGHQLSEQGYLVGIPQMLFNFPILDTNKANEIIDNYSSISHWFIGGVGRCFSSKLCLQLPQEASGLILLGAYPTEDTDFSNTQLPKLSIYAEHDDLTTLHDIKDTRNLLSKSVVFYQIDGGNHAQFGMYGPRREDRSANITVKEQ
ncbi:alpha/beta hydrolase [Gracilibacillus caseinilyticus]|uniref:Alpha/beta hydrolase n=1 Tax=Gracilibacillus caseinilyticus TaxID=2932256 RepID=A0ABY4EVD7_9BACI|nr:alpha/beta hydrolase [Gracilibacillus caseinilyticus]UOQ48367.1 alpha/beta hydrolase [Gracilibacillus caseinilyticus]